MAVVATENCRLADLTPAELEDEIATLASHIYAGTCRWLDLLAEIDRRGSWAESGSGSCAEWLAWRCALTPRAAREHVRVARRLPELPLIHAAFARGELSYAKVRALTRVADVAREEELLELARAMTAAQLERAVRAYRRVTADDANGVHSAAYVGYTWDADGSLFVQARLAPEDGALFLRALESARDSLWDREREQNRGSAEPRPGFRPTNADAFVAMADAALSSRDADRSGGERYQVVVHVDAAALSADRDGGSQLDEGPALAPETAQRLACDSSLVRLAERDGETLSIGRKTRTIPPALRRALRVRDRGCRFPGCENHRFVDAHHVHHWAQGGETKIDNLVLLCRRHHRFVHEGGYSVETVAEGEVRFRYPWGGLLADVPRSPPGYAERLAEHNRPLAIGPETCESGEGGDMDLGLAVDALMQLAGSTSVPNELEHPRNGRSSMGLLPSSLAAYPGEHPTGSAE